MKGLALLLFAGAAAALPAAAIDPYGGEGCRYEGKVGKDGLPEGKGIWSCQNGNRYEGGFKHGKFDGRGKFTVTPQGGIYIETLGSGSEKFRNMTFDGRFKNNRADGVHKVSENGEVLFVVTFRQGMIYDVKLPKKK
ncbi:MAG: hypothetical protein Q3966_07110 [Neisseria sp.]|nr:hypothetical protein [Neisseria sp.]